MTDQPLTEETPAERKKRLARERKQRQRERERAHNELLGMAPVKLEYSKGERETIETAAAARGFEDVAEYLFALVRADAVALKRDPSRNPAADAVGCHA